MMYLLTKIHLHCRLCYKQLNAEVPWSMVWQPDRALINIGNLKGTVAALGLNLILVFMTVLVLTTFSDLFVETTMENRNTFKDITTMKEFWMVS